MGQQFNDVSELVTDQGFLDWSQGAVTAESAIFREWLENDLAHHAMALEGKKLVESIVLQEKPLPEGQLEAALKRLAASINTQQHQAPVISIGRAVKRWWWAAAMFVLLAGAGLFISKMKHQPVQSGIAAGYGELLEHELPDGSMVTLNANSRIHISEGFENKKEREVWLTGEAFFHVKKTTDHKRFVVHTDRFDIVVTGTQFNVVNRGDKTNVLLTEGSVFLKMQDGRELKMVPGDFVELTGANDPSRKHVAAEKVLAWKDRKLVFENTPLHEAVQQIMDQYGVKILIPDQQLADTAQVSGIVPSDNLDLLLTLLEEGNGLKARKENGVLVIEKKSR
ncbi:FecR family protein [Flavihumibacter petaseus]|uniref:Putative anti-sigma factor n=1 Tax=Flavihumibacter petaseus NBRC 106054 TaxID=1220578 RepID=A0A0E9N2W2_9BACT|nr:FecR domain-containing protein [Flavihumibacter petaseus]GAO43690.1 putative anti-sigma factor [Flavihumibacter petaseus NBRC 106054]